MNETLGRPMDLGKPRIRLLTKKTSPWSHSGRKGDQPVFEHRYSLLPRTVTSIFPARQWSLFQGAEVALADKRQSCKGSARGLDGGNARGRWREVG